MSADESTAAQLVWSCRSHELLDWPAFESSSWVAAIQKDLISYYANNCRLPATSSNCQPHFSASVIMMLKDESDIIRANLNWLYMTGFRRFLIADNNSSDGSLKIVQEFRQRAWNAEVIIILDPLVRYTQSDKMTGLMRLAAAYWPTCNWIFPIDADEFLVASQGLDVLDRISPHVDAVVISKANHGLDQHHYAGPHKSWTDGMPLRSHLGCYPPKVALRARPEFVISQGNHEVIARSVAYAPGLDMGFHYREFQIRSFEQFKRRITNGAQAILAAQRSRGGSLGGNHWLDWYQVLVRSGDAGLREVFEKNLVGQYSINDPLDMEPPDIAGFGLPPAKPPLPNVALHRTANQSSVSAWSFRATTAEDAAGAVNGSITGEGSFHTDKEDSPWWTVDLGKPFVIKEIWIHNRLDDPIVARRFSEFSIEASIDGFSWVQIYATDAPQAVGGADGHPFIFRAQSPTTARFARIVLYGTDWLHLDEVEVFGLPPDGAPDKEAILPASGLGRLSASSFGEAVLEISNATASDREGSLGTLNDIGF